MARRMTAMTLREAGPAALITGLSALVLIGTRTLPGWDGFTPGPGFFPRIVGVAGLALAAAEIVQQLRARTVVGDALEDGALRRVGLTVFGLAALAVLAPLIGMSVGIALFMLFMLVVALKRPLLASVATAVGVAIAVELTFVRWLGVPLPEPFFL